MRRECGSTTAKGESGERPLERQHLDHTYAKGGWTVRQGRASRSGSHLNAYVRLFKSCRSLRISKQFKSDNESAWARTWRFNQRRHIIEVSHRLLDSVGTHPWARLWRS